jgi:hypothetical protein
MFSGSVHGDWRHQCKLRGGYLQFALEFGKAVCGAACSVGIMMMNTYMP